MKHSKRLWTRAYMRLDCLGFYLGQSVYVKPTGLRHKSPLGVTYWVFDGRKRLVQVSESAYGRNIGQLVKYAGLVQLQGELDAQGIKALDGGQYAGVNLKAIKQLIKRSGDR